MLLNFKDNNKSKIRYPYDQHTFIPRLHIWTSKHASRSHQQHLSRQQLKYISHNNRSYSFLNQR